MRIATATPKRFTVIAVPVLLLATPVVLYAQVAPKPPAPTLTPNHEKRSVEIIWTSDFPSGDDVMREVWA